jgi:hypothetical protein
VKDIELLFLLSLMFSPFQHLLAMNNQSIILMKHSIERTITEHFTNETDWMGSNELSVWAMRNDEVCH